MGNHVITLPASLNSTLTGAIEKIAADFSNLMRSLDPVRVNTQTELKWRRNESTDHIERDYVTNHGDFVKIDVSVDVSNGVPRNGNVKLILYVQDLNNNVEPQAYTIIVENGNVTVYTATVDRALLPLQELAQLFEGLAMFVPQAAAV